MAITDEGAELTRRHRRQQLGIRADALRDFNEVWLTWDFGDPDSYDRMVTASSAVVAERNRESSEAAVRYLRGFHVVEGQPGQPDVVVADRPSREQVRQSMDASGRAGVMRAVAAGFSPQAAAQAGQVRAAGTVGRLTMRGQQDTLVASARRNNAKWQRVASADACAFCAMTASRGPVYSEQTAHFNSHDHCACSVELAYRGSRMPDTSQRYRDKWDEAQHRARDDPDWASAATSNDELNNFRRLLGHN